MPSVYATDLEIASAAYERQVDELVADDEETAGYVTDLEEAYDANVDTDPHVVGDGALDDDPDTLVAEVERFLRDNE